MQKVFFAVLLFYYACVAVPVTTIMVVVESYINDHAILFWSYSGAQYGWMLAVAIVNFVGLCAATVAS